MNELGNYYLLIAKCNVYIPISDPQKRDIAKTGHFFNFSMKCSVNHYAHLFIDVFTCKYL